MNVWPVGLSGFVELKAGNGAEPVGKQPEEAHDRASVGEAVPESAEMD